MFILFLFTLIFTVFTACNNNSCLPCPYLHWYSQYLLLLTIIDVYCVLFTLIFTVFTACNLFILFLFTLIFTVFTACNYNSCLLVSLFTLIFTVFTACSYNCCLLCSYLHWYSLYLLLATIIEIYFVPIYIDIHCIYCLLL